MFKINCKYVITRNKIVKNFAKCCSTNNKSKTEPTIKLPEEPTSCCMSGCANCVWIAYAEELTKIFNDGGEKAQKIIMERVQDPNIRAFLATELRMLKK